MSNLMTPVRYKIEQNYNEHVYYVDQIMFNKKYYWVILLAPASYGNYMASDGTIHDGVGLAINHPKSLFTTPEEALKIFHKMMKSRYKQTKEQQIGFENIENLEQLIILAKFLYAKEKKIRK